MFTFFRLPKCLVNNVYFAELSADAKLLYAFFLDRVSLSIKNGWIDDKGRVLPTKTFGLIQKVKPENSHPDCTPTPQLMLSIKTVIL